MLSPEPPNSSIAQNARGEPGKMNAIPGCCRTAFCVISNRFWDEGEHPFRQEAEQFQAEGDWAVRGTSLWCFTGSGGQREKSVFGKGN
jgi:hypothetical protein